MSAACLHPLADEVLQDYWCRDGDPSEAERVEEHLFACASCSRRLEALAELARGVAEVAARRGGMAQVVTASLVAGLEARGVRMRHYRPAPGERVACTVGRDDDLVVSWLPVTPPWPGRIDVEICDAGGQLLSRLPDVPRDAAAPQVAYALAGDELRGWPDTTIQIRVVGVTEEAERMLGEFTFEHRGYRPAP